MVRRFEESLAPEVRVRVARVVEVSANPSDIVAAAEELRAERKKASADAVRSVRKKAGQRQDTVGDTSVPIVRHTAVFQLAARCRQGVDEDFADADEESTTLAAARLGAILARVWDEQYKVVRCRSQATAKKAR